MALTKINIDDISGVPQPGSGDLGKVLSYSAAGTFTWVQAATGDLVVKLGGIAAGAEVNAAANLGAGIPLYASKVGGNLQFRSLKPGDGISITASASEITISNTGSGSGGSGVNRFTALVDVPSNLIGAAGRAAIISATENGIDLGPTLGTAASLNTGDVALAGHSHSSATGSAAGFMSAADKAKLDSVAANSDVTSGLNVGTGAAVFAGKVTGNLTFRTMRGTGSISVSVVDDEVVFSSPGGGVSAFTQLSDVPTAYTGAANKVVLVNSSANGLTFGNVLGTAAYQNTGAFAAASHPHIIGDVTGLQAALDAKVGASHSQPISDITGLQAALDGKSAVGHTHTASAISDSTTVGRAVLTATDAAAVRAAAGAFASAGGAVSGPVSATIAGGAAKGSVSSGTATFNLSDGNKQTITVAGAHTWAFTGWPASGTYGELEVFATNAGAAAITLPTVQWVKGDGTASTTFSSMGVTLQASGLNHFLLWTVNAGSTIYGRAF